MRSLVLPFRYFCWVAPENVLRTKHLKNVANLSEKMGLYSWY